MDRSQQSEIIYKSIIISSGVYNFEKFNVGGLGDSATETYAVDILKENSFESITINEDMFAPSLSGQIVLKDVSDFGSRLPLIGNEILWITVQEPGNEQERTLTPLHIYSVDQIDVDSNARGFVCYFAAIELTLGGFDPSHLDEFTGLGPNLDPECPLQSCEDGEKVLDPLTGTMVCKDQFEKPFEKQVIDGERGVTAGQVEPWDAENKGAEYYGKISDFVKHIIDGDNIIFDHFTKKNFLTEDENGNPALEMRLRTEETSNKIWYKPNDTEYSSYSSIRKDGSQKLLELLHQCAENAYNEKEDKKIANFVFYQDLFKWNFKSIHTMIEEGEDVPDDKVYNYELEISSNSRSGSPIRNTITKIDKAKRLDYYSLLENGAYVSHFSFYKPLIDYKKYPIWFSKDLNRMYYRKNCTYSDRFPAAIIGFQQIDQGIPQWRYAFVEVYLEFDYVRRKPSFRVKPLDKGGLRSYVGYGGTAGASGPYLIFESGYTPHDTITSDEATDNDNPLYNYFARPAYNTMEVGNDGYVNYDSDDDNGRLGWEAPGVRLDSKLWEKGCYKIQPIRGSFLNPLTGFPGLNLTTNDKPAVRNNTVDYIPDGGGDVGIYKNAAAGNDGMMMHQYSGPETAYANFEELGQDPNKFMNYTGNLYNPIEDGIVSGSYPVVDMKIYYDQQDTPHYFFTAANTTDGTCDSEDEDPNSSKPANSPDAEGFDCKDERVVGACCFELEAGFPDCYITGEKECNERGYRYLGDNSTCDQC